MDFKTDLHLRYSFGERSLGLTRRSFSEGGVGFSTFAKASVDKVWILSAVAAAKAGWFFHLR